MVTTVIQRTELILVSSATLAVFCSTSTINTCFLSSVAFTMQFLRACIPRPKWWRTVMLTAFQYLIPIFNQCYGVTTSDGPFQPSRIQARFHVIFVYSLQFVLGKSCTASEVNIEHRGGWTNGRNWSELVLMWCIPICLHIDWFLGKCLKCKSDICLVFLRRRKEPQGHAQKRPWAGSDAEKRAAVCAVCPGHHVTSPESHTQRWVNYHKWSVRKTIYVEQVVWDWLLIIIFTCIYSESPDHRMKKKMLSMPYCNLSIQVFKNQHLS